MVIVKSKLDSNLEFLLLKHFCLFRMVRKVEDEMTPEMIQRFDEWTKENFKNSDINF